MHLFAYIFRTALVLPGTCVVPEVHRRQIPLHTCLQLETRFVAKGHCWQPQRSVRAVSKLHNTQGIIPRQAKAVLCNAFSLIPEFQHKTKELSRTCTEEMAACSQTQTEQALLRTWNSGLCHNMWPGVGRAGKAFPCFTAAVTPVLPDILIYVASFGTEM